MTNHKLAEIKLALKKLNEEIERLEEMIAWQTPMGSLEWAYLIGEFDRLKSISYMATAELNGRR